MELYTIGYEGLNEKSFLAWLNRYNISIVADVRQVPLSRKKGFSKTALNKILSKHNINYINFQSLGTTKEMREELKKTGNYKKILNKFRRTLNEKTQDLDEIHTLLDDGKNVTLLCFERDPQMCHRRIVAEEIKKRDGNGLKVKHIQPL